MKTFCLSYDWGPMIPGHSASDTMPVTV